MCLGRTHTLVHTPVTTTTSRSVSGSCTCNSMYPTNTNVFSSDCSACFCHTCRLNILRLSVVVQHTCPETNIIYHLLWLCSHWQFNGTIIIPTSITSDHTLSRRLLARANTYNLTTPYSCILICGITRHSPHHTTRTTVITCIFV